MGLDSQMNMGGTRPFIFLADKTRKKKIPIDDTEIHFYWAYSNEYVNIAFYNNTNALI